MWHCEGPLAAQYSKLPKHWGCLQTSHLWDGCNAWAIKMTKRWRLKWSMGLLFPQALNLTEVFWSSISKWEGKKFVKQSFVILILGGKMPNVVSSLHWLWFLPEVPKNRAILKIRVTGEHDVCLCKANTKLVCWSILDPQFWIHKQVFEPRVLKYQPDVDQKLCYLLIQLMCTNQYSFRTEYLKKIIHTLFAVLKELIEQFLKTL